MLVIRNNIIKSKNSSNNKWLIFLILILGMGLNENLLGANQIFIEDKVKDTLGKVIKSSPDTTFRNEITNELGQSAEQIKDCRADKLKIQVGGKTQDFSKLTPYGKGKVLARSFGGLIGGDKYLEERYEKVEYCILNGLQYKEESSFSLGLIRSFCDLEQEADLGILKTNDDPKTLTSLFKLTNQIFYHSRKLLGLVITSDIAKFYGIHYMNNGNPNVIMDSLQVIKNIDEKTKNKNKIVIQNFSIDDVKLQSIFTKKTEGIHFGAIVEVKDSNVDDEEYYLPKRFFLKAYHGYPAIESKDSSDTMMDTSRMVSSTGGEETTSITIEKLDLKEPFVYNFFSGTNLGPNAIFAINPYINNGFFIFTEDLSDSSTSISFTEGSQFGGINNKVGFIERLGDMKMSIKKRKDIEINDSIFQEEEIKQVFIDTTELSIISLMFKLDDIKDENFGFVIDEIHATFSGPFIVDFLTPSSREVETTIPNYSDDHIRKKFVTGKNVFVTIRGTADSVYSRIINSLDILDNIKLYETTKSDITDINNKIAPLRNKQEKDKQKLSQKEQRELSNLEQKIKIKNNALKNTLKNLGTEEQQILSVKRDLNEKLYLGKLALQKFQNRLYEVNSIKLSTPHYFGIDPRAFILQRDEGTGEYTFIEKDEFVLEQILEQKASEIKSLMLQQRGVGDNQGEIMLKHPITNQPRTNAELIGFKSETGFAGTKRLRPTEESLNLEYIEDAFEDLDNYCQGVMSNYIEIKELLNTNVDNLIGEFFQPIVSE